MILVQILLAIGFGYTALSVVYLLFFAVAGRLRRMSPIPEADPAASRRIAVLIPAYREDAVIVDSAKSALEQAYPAEAYDVIVIADSLRPTTLTRLRSLPIRVIEVSFDTSTKAKALNAALRQLTAPYEIAVILDADNQMAPDFLRQVHAAFGRGWRVVQGHRTAKNTNTSVAVLDAVSEEVNNHIFRQGHRAVGLSAALIGSGMAFEYGLLTTLMPEVQAVGGFDKELEMRLLRQRVTIGYLDQAFVYDEKVQSEAVFERQRTRWIAAQFRYLRRNAGPGLRALLTGNLDYADKVWQTLLPPRVILLGSLVLGVALSALLRDAFWFAFTTTQLLILLFTFYLSVPASLARQVGLNEVVKLPMLFVRFLSSIRKMNLARHQFLHTPHGADEGNG